LTAGYDQSQFNRGQSDNYGGNAQDFNNASGGGRTKDSQSSGGYGGQGDTQGYGGGDQCTFFFFILWRGMLRWPLLDGGQTQSDSGAYQGGGVGGGATGGGGRSSSGLGSGDQSYGDDNTECKSFFFSFLFYFESSLITRSIQREHAKLCNTQPGNYGDGGGGCE
jgi:hypothetical protein